MPFTDNPESTEPRHLTPHADTLHSGPGPAVPTALPRRRALVTAGGSLSGVLLLGMLGLGACSVPRWPSSGPSPSPAPSPAPSAAANRSPTAPAPSPSPNRAQPGAATAAAPVPSRQAPARNWSEYTVQAAQRLVQMNPETSYMGTPPDPLLAIPVLEVELYVDGSIANIRVQRTPTQAKDTVQLAMAAVRRAAPFPAVGHLPKPWRFTEVFLFDDQRRFKPRTLD
ncbi:MAG: hypothetical protein LW854_21430 [Rubrivivax sp.]|nr:hypothetical protein [Rubrivivax sp.]